MTERSQPSTNDLGEENHPPLSQDEHAQLARLDAETSKIVAEQAILVERQKDFKQNREERKKYTKITFWGVAVWLVIVLAILMASGFKIMSFELPGYVLAILLSGTIIGAGVVVGAIMTALYKGGDSYTEQPRRRDNERQEK